MGEISGLKFKLGVSMEDVVNLLDESSKKNLTIRHCHFDESEAIKT